MRLYSSWSLAAGFENHATVKTMTDFLLGAHVARHGRGWHGLYYGSCAQKHTPELVYLGKMRNDIGDELIEDAREVVETVRLFRRAAISPLRLSLGHFGGSFFLARQSQFLLKSVKNSVAQGPVAQDRLEFCGRKQRF